MNHPKPPFFSRLLLGLRTVSRMVSDHDFATRVQHLDATAPAPSIAQTPSLRDTAPAAALQLLALLQQHGRFIDFIEENVSAYSDAEIGNAARVVHEGCRKVLRQYVQLAPLRSEAEGTRLTLEAGFDPAALRLVGNVVGQAPFTGTLLHRGWQVTDISLPQVSATHPLRILAAAEVEI